MPTPPCMTIIIGYKFSIKKLHRNKKSEVITCTGIPGGLLITMIAGS